MYVCHCKVVTDRDVMESMANGARCIADLARDTGAGRSCGGCVATLRALVSGPERRPDLAVGVLDPGSADAGSFDEYQPGPVNRLSGSTATQPVAIRPVRL